MRWPIRSQLLLPILLVVVAAVTAVSAASAWFLAAQAKKQQEASAERLAQSIATASFPLTGAVLRQMSGLSGAEFILLDHQGKVHGGTLTPDEHERMRLAGLPLERPRGDFSQSPVVEMAGRKYLAQRLAVSESRTEVRPGSLVVLYPEGPWRAAIRRAAYPLVAVGILAVAVVALVTTALAGRLIARIRRLGDQTAAIAGGDFTPLAIDSPNDEIRDLAASINQMTDKLSRYEAEVRQNERLRTLGQLGAAVAHQLRNSATGALMAIELHQRECAAVADGQSLEVAVRQLKLMESYLQRFLSLGTSGPDLEDTISLGPLVADALELVRPACTHAKIDAAFDVPADPLHVRGDAESLRQMLVNLLINAVEAAARPATGPARVVVKLARLEADRAVIAIEDSGPGPAADIRERLFEPFATDKPDGTGLGLSVARRVVEAHGGTIRWQRQEETTCFAVELPILEPREEHGTPADR